MSEDSNGVLGLLIHQAAQNPQFSCIKPFPLCQNPDDSFPLSSLCPPPSLIHLPISFLRKDPVTFLPSAMKSNTPSTTEEETRGS